MTVYDEHLANAMGALRAINAGDGPTSTELLHLAQTEALVSIAVALGDIRRRLPAGNTRRPDLPGFLGGTADDDGHRGHRDDVDADL